MFLTLLSKKTASGAITGSVSATLEGLSGASSSALRLAGSASAGLDGMTLTAGATLAGGGSLIALNSRLVYLGDSLIASGPMRSARQLGQVYVNSRMRPGVGCNQGVGGDRIDQMFARINQTIAQAPSLVVFNGGTNDIAANHTLGTMQTNHQSIVDALIAAGVTQRVRWTIPKSTSITGEKETLRQDFNAWLATRTDITLVDLESVYDPTTADSYDGVHPTWIGARKIAAAEAAIVGPLLAAGTTLYADASDATAQGNLEADWDFTGTSGAVSGSSLPTGQVAAGWTVTNNTSCTVACSKTTIDGFGAQVIDITGTASAQNTVRLTNTISLSPSFNPGDFIDCAIQLSITGTDGVSVPTGARGILIQAGSIANWGSNNPDASAQTPIDSVISGVFRTEPIGLSSTAASVAFEVTVQIPIGAADIRLVASRLKATKSEQTAYATPLAITSGKTLPRVTGTASVGSTLTAENQTWAGGGITYTYQWQRGTTDISGSTSRTYVAQAGDAGSTLRCVITGTNANGNSSFTTANTAIVGGAGGGVAGAANVTLAGVAASGSGALRIAGTASATLQSLTLASVASLGASGINGSASITLADVAASGAGALRISAALTASLAGLSGAASGALRLSGSATATLANLSLASSSALGGGNVTASASIALAPLASSVSGALRVLASGAAPLEGLSVSSLGALLGLGAAGPILQPVAFSAAGILAVRAQVQARLGDMAVQAFGTSQLVFLGGLSPVVIACRADGPVLIPCRDQATVIRCQL
jgi:lysophospholipase L1-like esterase